MSRIRTTTWPIEPHTLAKHVILENYLQRWFPILSYRRNRIVFIDGFAGPGEYQGGEEGSPVIALKTACEHKSRERFTEIVFIFIEKHTGRAAKLKEVLSERFPILPDNIKYHVISAEFASTLDHILDGLEKNSSKLAPTFAFIDPFGFTGFPMELIRRLMCYNSCEVFVTFMVNFVRRFHDEHRADALNALYGTDEWRKVDEITNPKDTELFFLRLYEKQLKEHCGVKYVRNFAMINRNNQTIYYLIFGTKHPKGLHEMKEAMYMVNAQGEYYFSDRTDPNQQHILDYLEVDWEQNVANMIFRRFRGETVSISTIEDFILTSPYCFRKSILIFLEKQGKIVDVRLSRTRRDFTYPSGCAITFSG